MKSSAKIFLAGDRGVDEAAHFRSFKTLNFGDYFNPAKEKVNHLFGLNDTWIAGGKSLNLTAPKDSTVILLPVVGAVEILEKTDSQIIVAGQVFITNLEKDQQLNVQNLFAHDSVNVLELWLQSPAETDPEFSKSEANLNNMNALLPMVDVAELCKMFIGKFSGRGETTFATNNTNKSVYVFVLSGAFEVCGRLLHERDGLVLYNEEEIDMEALSNDALLLLLEQ